jgi:hypothetical protein
MGSRRSCEDFVGGKSARQMLLITKWIQPAPKSSSCSSSISSYTLSVGHLSSLSRGGDFINCLSTHNQENRTTVASHKTNLIAVPFITRKMDVVEK